MLSTATRPLHLVAHVKINAIAPQKKLSDSVPLTTDASKLCLSQLWLFECPSKGSIIAQAYTSCPTTFLHILQQDNPSIACSWCDQNKIILYKMLHGRFGQICCPRSPITSRMALAGISTERDPWLSSPFWLSWNSSHQRHMEHTMNASAWAQGHDHVCWKKCQEGSSVMCNTLARMKPPNCWHQGSWRLAIHLAACRRETR